MRAAAWRVIAVACVTVAVSSLESGLAAVAGPHPAHPAVGGVPDRRGIHATNDRLANPSTNTPPSQAFLNACYDMGSSAAANDICDSAALVDFDAVRAAEGLGPMTLPADFDTMSVPVQLLTISDTERVDRGLPAITGLSSTIDAVAQQGADDDSDPPWPDPFNGTAGTANWAAGGNSALLDDFYWMYDDGYGAVNGDCPTPKSDGCWGHRDDILYDFDTPLVMGAAVSTGTAVGTSMTEEFIGGDSTDKADVSPTWATISGTAPPTLSTSSVTVHTDTATPGSTTVRVTAGTANSSVSATVTGGDGSWSVSPSSCTFAAAGDRCDLTVSFDPPSSGTHDATLAVTWDSTSQSVSLAGRQSAPRLAISASRRHVTRAHRVTVTGTVLAGRAGTPLAHQKLVLQRRRGHHKWSRVDHRRSDADGAVSSRVRPHRSARYRWKALGADGSGEGHSHHVRIRVHPG